MKARSAAAAVLGRARRAGPAAPRRARCPWAAVGRRRSRSATARWTSSRIAEVVDGASSDRTYSSGSGRALRPRSAWTAAASCADGAGSSSRPTTPRGTACSSTAGSSEGVQCPRAGAGAAARCRRAGSLRGRRSAGPCGGRPRPAVTSTKTPSPYPSHGDASRLQLRAPLDDALHRGTAPPAEPRRAPRRIRKPSGPRSGGAAIPGRATTSRPSRASSSSRSGSDGGIEERRGDDSLPAMSAPSALARPQLEHEHQIVDARPAPWRRWRSPPASRRRAGRRPRRSRAACAIAATAAPSR